MFSRLVNHATVSLTIPLGNDAFSDAYFEYLVNGLPDVKKYIYILKDGLVGYEDFSGVYACVTPAKIAHSFLVLLVLSLDTSTSVTCLSAQGIAGSTTKGNDYEIIAFFTPQQTLNSSIFAD